MANAGDNLAIKVVNVLVYIFLFGSNLYGSLQPSHASKTTYITPANYAFWIWTLINLLLLGQVILQFFAAGYEVIVERIGWRFAITGLLNAIFAHLWATNHQVWAFVVSLFLASSVSTVYWSLRNAPPKSGATAIFVHTPWSLWHAWTVVLVIVSGFGAFGRDAAHHHAGIGTRVCVIIALVFLASTSAGYAFNSAKGDIAGAAVIAWTLLAIFSAQRHPATIHWVALGAFIVSLLAVAKAAFTAFRGRSVLEDNERAPLLSGE